MDEPVIFIRSVFWVEVFTAKRTYMAPPKVVAHTKGAATILIVIVIVSPGDISSSMMAVAYIYLQYPPLPLPPFGVGP